MAGKRSNGEGSVRKTKNGSWRGEIMDGYTPDGKKNIVRFTAETRAEVLDKLRAYRAGMDSGVHIDKRMCFADWADTWYGDYKSEVQPSTYSGYQYTLKALKKGFGDQPLAEILPIHVNRFLDIWLNDLVPELKQTMDDGKLSFTPAVEISRVRPKHQKYIAVSIEGQQASPSKGQAKRLRELDKENKLSPDVIDGILCEEKKKEDRDVIITGAELEKFFGKEATPRQMKDQIMTLLEDWKERQPPELAKPDKKMDMEK